MNTFLRTGTFRFFILLLLLNLISAGETSFAQVKFSVVCPQKKIGKNEILQIQFKVENASNIDNITPPSFKDFNIVGGPNQQSGMSNINGKINQYVAIGYDLQPKSTGKFAIGPAKAHADGKDYVSAPITIEVTNASTAQSNNNSANPPNPFSPFANFNFDLPSLSPTHQFDDYILKPGENAAAKVKKDLFIKLDVSKTSCYIGEPITASYKLYTRLRSESTITNAPSFNGFSVSDLDVSNNNNESIEKYNGRQYNVYTLRKVELYPLQSGSITLDPLVSTNKVTFIKSEYANSQNGDQFFDMLQNFADATTPSNGMVEKSVTLKSKPVIINVKPLPDENKPLDFKGAVGNFAMQSALEKNNITTDDAGKLTVTIRGEGNIQLINAPKINWPEGIDGYDAKVNDHVDKAAFPMRGSKIFTFPFTISQPGNYTIEPLSFSYFDPSTSEYKTITTSSLNLTVSKGSGFVKNNFAKKSSTFTGNQNVFANIGFDITLGAILSIGALLFIFYTKNKKKKIENDLEKNIKVDDIQNKTVEKEPEFIIPESPLLLAHEKLIAQDSVEFYHVLDVSLKRYLSAKFKVPADELTKKRLNEELDKCNVGLGTSHMLNSLLEEVEINLYAPPSNTNHLKSLFEKASEVVSLLDKQVC
ncbi:MAG: BatD family protein [Bacteroidota bacterium]|nr:BatD family protein [Bacteroidota bacterium]